MNRVAQLTIEDCFRLCGLGVVLRPDFSVPNGRWMNRTETVVVVKPDGHEFEATAQFNLWHFNIPDPNVSIDRRWRVVVPLPGRTKDELPPGSQILVWQELRDALLTSNVV